MEAQVMRCGTRVTNRSTSVTTNQTGLQVLSYLLQPRNITFNRKFNWNIRIRITSTICENKVVGCFEMPDNPTLIPIKNYFIHFEKFATQKSISVRLEVRIEQNRANIYVPKSTSKYVRINFYEIYWLMTRAASIQYIDDDEFFDR